MNKVNKKMERGFISFTLGIAAARDVQWARKITRLSQKAPWSESLPDEEKKKIRFGSDLNQNKFSSLGYGSFWVLKLVSDMILRLEYSVDHQVVASPTSLSFFVLINHFTSVEHPLILLSEKLFIQFKITIKKRGIP